MATRDPLAPCGYCRRCALHDDPAGCITVEAWVRENPADAVVAAGAQLGMAGWGCPDPRDPWADFLSDGYDTPDEAIEAALGHLRGEAQATREIADLNLPI